MRNYLKNIFPSLAATFSFFILPIIVSVYFVVTGYSDRFVSEQNINYFDVQGNFLSKALITDSWISWFNRFMDFAVWGIVAAVILVALWLFSSAKIATKNHYQQESFENFKDSKNSWHRHFFIVALLKVILGAIVIYSILAIIGKSVPQLETTITIALQDYSAINLRECVLAGLSIVLLQYMIITSIKTFKHLSLD
jgi:hypothetical protein